MGSAVTAGTRAPARSGPVGAVQAAVGGWSGSAAAGGPPAPQTLPVRGGGKANGAGGGFSAPEPAAREAGEPWATAGVAKTGRSECRSRQI